jgi:hypothetical protein
LGTLYLVSTCLEPHVNATSARVRTIATVLAGAVAAIAAPVATVFVWFRWQLLDGERAVKLLAPVGREESVRTDIVAVAANQLTARAERYEQLPQAAGIRPLIDQLGGVAAAIGLIRDEVQQFVLSERFTAIWDQIVASQYTRLIEFVKGRDQTVLQLSNGDVSLDLAALATGIDQLTDGPTGDLIGSLGSEPISIQLFHLRSLDWLEWAARNATIGALLFSALAVGGFALVALLASNRAKAIAWTAAGALLAVIVATYWINAELEDELRRIHEPNAQSLATSFADAIADSLLRGFGIAVLALALVVLAAFLTPRLRARQPKRTPANPLIEPTL